MNSLSMTSLPKSLSLYPKINCEYLPLILSRKEVKILVDSVKKNIKNKKTDSPSKILALKLLHLCIMNGNNEEFFQYCEKKIMKRLVTLARYKKVNIHIYFLGI